MSDFPPSIAIVGPTAVGKSRLALDLAEKIGADIVSADSRQVYRYMDIGTDKPTLDERRGIRHYMLDVVSPADTYSAQRFAREGREVLRRIAASGRVAIVAGGTGFYVRSLLDGSPLGAVEPNPALREELRRQADELGPVALHDRLGELDPVSAARIHPHNLPRLIRALEIVQATGRPVQSVEGAEAIPALRIGLRMDRIRLREIAAQRIHRQIRSGLVEETRLLLAMGYSPELPALQGFGYRQMIEYLHGDRRLDEAIALYRTATNQYIRRQMTWFRADSRIEWVQAGDGALPAIRDRVERWLESKGSAE